MTTAALARVKTSLHSAGVQKALADSLGRSISPDRFTSIAWRAYRYGSESLRAADPDSFVASIIEAGHLGLNPDPLVGEVYLVPYKGQVTLQIGYTGLMKLMLAGGGIETIASTLVYEGDEFVVRGGTDPGVHHVISDPAGRKVFAAYAVAFVRGASRPITRVVYRAELEAAQARSRGGTFWRDHYEAMVRKTAIRRLYSLARGYVSLDAGEAIARDEARERGDEVEKFIEIEAEHVDRDPLAELIEGDA